MASDYVSEAHIIDIEKRTTLQIFATGLVVGAAIWGLSWLLDRYAVAPLACGGATLVASCNSAIIAGHIASILGMIGGVLALVRFGVFRPLLIGLAALVSLWGAMTWLIGVQWYVALPTVAVLYALAYTVFAWLSRIRNFIVTLIAIALVIVTCRLLVSL